MRRDTKRATVIILLLLCGTILIMGCSKQPTSQSVAIKQYAPATVATTDVDAPAGAKAAPEPTDTATQDEQDDGLDEALADLEALE